MASGWAIRPPQSSCPMETLSSCPKSTESAAAKILAKKSNEEASIEICGRLPVEILQHIFMSLDLATLHSVRQVNSFYLCVVHQTPAYNLLSKHAAETLQIMHLTDTARFFSLRRVFDEFCQPQCQTCGNFGPYIFLLNCKRCCFKCILTCSKHLLGPVCDLSELFFIPASILDKHLVTLRSLPGEYGFPETQLCMQREWLTSFTAGLDLKKTVYKTREEAEKAAVTFQNSPECDMRRPICWPERGKKSVYINKLRLMGSTPFPFWDKEKRTVESGTYCVGCVWHHKHTPFYATRAYLMCNLPQHFANCHFAATFMSLPPHTKAQVLSEFGEKFFVNADGQIGDIPPEEKMEKEEGKGKGSLLLHDKNAC
ncbi:hypothetical protein VTN96DRAFT_2219 [Rasamsonia emersonii]